ncbi:MAG: DEAD/DEAH box helicase [Planctomycetaceae bacterium]|nr:DEAD/DEAH box helicase [Planctomycetaceae bacterium]
MTVSILPSGRIFIVVEDDVEVTVLERRLVDAFGVCYENGLLYLATVELTAVLSLEFDFLRSFAKEYFTRLCHQPDEENKPPTLAEFEFFLVNVPPMNGAEYLNSEVLTEWWNCLDKFVRNEIKKHSQNTADWIQKQNPLWRTVGRVTFHLAENKRDESRPFAFMATYTDKVSAGAKPVQLPLSKALTEYASAKDRNGLLRLLQPINNAAEKCDWVRAMVDDQTVYQPRAWTAKQAYELLQNIPALEESGLIVRVPDWWKNKHAARPQVKINIGTKNTTNLSVNSLLEFHLETVLDGKELTPEELNELFNADGSLIRLRGEWVEIDRNKLNETLEHWRKVNNLVEQDGLTFYEGMRMLSGLPIDGKWDETDKELAYRDWAEVVPIGSFAETLAALRDPNRAEEFSLQNIGLNATLRPYQEIGVRWLQMLTQLGLGACLADDMGLGKTIQVITLLLLKKNSGTKSSALLIAPASLLGNWESEVKKFTPSLKIHIAHSSGAGTKPPENLSDINLVITTYGMTERIEWLKKQKWDTIILDEAQAIKNAGTRQAKAVKELQTKQRIAMTGTPIENRLSDLWSLFDFLNPGLLGNKTAFTRFVKSLQDQNNKVNYAPLRKLTSPYILRRLKTDKNIISDLPDKTEVTAWCSLSKQQTVLYSQAVEKLKSELKMDYEGIQRRGIVLSALMRFKQICNHPSQYTGDGNYKESLSGKFERLREICEEIASRQEKVLVFTQFREITEPLAQHLQTVFRRKGLILDGSTPVKKRKEMTDIFQNESGLPFFVLSLKAGGTGLNLTAAQHVIHFDRWWNPAVENQATDRAFRIGQKKNVLVHKFICRGTLEEKINELLENKKSIAKNVIEENNEQLITEMNDSQLLQLVALDINKSFDE